MAAAEAAVGYTPEVAQKDIKKKGWKSQQKKKARARRAGRKQKEKVSLGEAEEALKTLEKYRKSGLIQVNHYRALRELLSQKATQGAIVDAVVPWRERQRRYITEEEFQKKWKDLGKKLLETKKAAATVPAAAAPAAPDPQHVGGQRLAELRRGRHRRQGKRLPASAEARAREWVNS